MIKRRHRPVAVDLTVQLSAGPGREAVTLVRDRRIPVVGTVFENRDRIARAFLKLLVQAGLRRRPRR